MKQIVVIGGGFFGMYLADYFSTKGHAVTLIEREQQFMTRASYNNQARIHNGYHYPRSILTALRSRISFPRFVAEFPDCTVSDFKSYYLIGRPLGKVSAKQFFEFCHRIGAPIELAPQRIRAMTNLALIEESFSVVEYAFDAVKLRDEMIRRLDGSTARCAMHTEVESVRPLGDGLLVELQDLATHSINTIYADHVFNCTYSRINHLNSRMNLDFVPLKHEMTEMCMVEVPDEIKRIAITVMCGPFFSVMPFPPLDLHSFSHVRYTPHYEWTDKDRSQYQDSSRILKETTLNSAWRYMQKDASRYIPLLSECSYRRSLVEIKTVLPRSESDDSRPILFLPHHGMKGFHCIMGGKIDNVYDVVEAVAAQTQIT